ncbi:hypothetical protein T492DRAFT_903471 [Pavlovales sp. CCMP2436]|nr:hypothetical protein T492DRAFT_903471 [Pavlovales sp. CCMP2436]
MGGGAGQGIGRNEANAVDLGLAWFYRPGEGGTRRTFEHYDEEVWMPVRAELDWVKLETLLAIVKRLGPPKPRSFAELPLLPDGLALWSKSSPVPLISGLGVYAWRLADGSVGITAAEQDNHCNIA